MITLKKIKIFYKNHLKNIKSNKKLKQNKKLKNNIYKSLANKQMKTNKIYNEKYYKNLVDICPTKDYSLEIK